MDLIFCTSHLYIPITLSIINKSINGFCVYTDRLSIFTFFCHLYHKKHVFLLNRNTKTGRLGKLIVEPYEQKKRMLEFVEGKNIDRIVFFHEGFCQEANWLILKLSKMIKPEILYVPIERTFTHNNRCKEDFSLEYVLKKIRTYFIWGFRIHYYHYLNNIYPVMDLSFFRRIHSKEIDLEEIGVNAIPEINYRLLNVNEYPENGFVWLENTLRCLKVKWSEETYVKFVKEGLDIIGRDNVYYKGHPDLVEKYGEEKTMKDIPSFIPGNLILKRFSCFIGVFSDLLFEAANAGTPAISTLYLVELDDREKYVDYLKSKNDSIYFPKTISEFAEVVGQVRSYK